MTPRLLLAALLAVARVAASDSGPADTIARLEACADACSVERDDDGRVVRLALSNHQQHRPGNDKAVPGRRGLADGDLPDLLALTGLRALFLEKQALTAAGYARLAELPALEDLRIHYPGDRFVFGGNGLAPLDAGFAAFIDRLPAGLRHLELKHGFDVRGDGGRVLAALAARPRLEKLELDTVFATPAAVPFVLGSPRLVDLQLHRTSMGDADLQRLFTGLRHLRILEVRPVANAADPVRAHSLRGLRDHPALERLYLSLAWGELVFEGGLEHLVTIPTLRLLSVPALGREDPAVVAFHRARPDVSVDVRGSDDIAASVPPTLGRDAETTWGVTQ